MPINSKFGLPEDNPIPSDTGLTIDSILMSRYKIQDRIYGNKKNIYKARDLLFPDSIRLVTIKELSLPSTDNPMAYMIKKTLEREANLLAILNHPAIPKIYDFFPENNSIYFVTEYINGMNLDDIIQKTKTLPITKILEWSIALCELVNYLHQHSPDPIILRDIKPSNIMIDASGDIHFVDFSSSKLYISNSLGTRVGTEGYIAPEQYEGKDSPLSDIYGLGATLHHLFTRVDPRLKAPFSFASSPISMLNSEASIGLEKIIMKALEFSPENRYQSIEEMKIAFETLRDNPDALDELFLEKPRPIKVFISYRKADKALVEVLEQELLKMTEMIQSVWIDKHLVADDVWWAKILESIRDADVIITAVSNAYLDSEPCRREYNYAIALGKDVKLVKISDFDYRRLPAELAQKQEIDFTTKNAERLTLLHDIFSKTKPARPLPFPLPDEPEAPLSELVKLEKRATQQTINREDEAFLFSGLHSYITGINKEERETALKIVTNLQSRIDDISAKFFIQLQRLEEDAKRLQ